jgi:hypothetical protein
MEPPAAGGNATLMTPGRRFAGSRQLSILNPSRVRNLHDYSATEGSCGCKVTASTGENPSGNS